jgi:hypothetical protein
MALEWGSGEFWARFAIASLATWRIAHLFAFEDGPGDAVVWLRQKAGFGFFGKLMDCFYCLSLWIAAPFAPFVNPSPAKAFIAWVALSGSACLLERATSRPIPIDRS